MALDSKSAVFNVDDKVSVASSWGIYKYGVIAVVTEHAYMLADGRWFSYGARKLLSKAE